MDTISSPKLLSPRVLRLQYWEQYARFPSTCHSPLNCLLSAHLLGISKLLFLSLVLRDTEGIFKCVYLPTPHIYEARISGFFFQPGTQIFTLRTQIWICKYSNFRNILPLLFWFVLPLALLSLLMEKAGSLGGGWIFGFHFPPF